MSKTKLKQIHFITSATLILLIGLFSGYCLGYLQASIKRFPQIKTTQDINKNTPTIKLMETSGGLLMGEITGQKTRIAYSPDGILELKPGAHFEIPLNQIHLKNFYQNRKIPKDVLFIGSKKGKYYYSVFDKKAYNISEKNRLYFKSETEAETYGLQKRD